MKSSKLSRRRSTSTWLRTPKEGEESAIWYDDEEDWSDPFEETLKDDESVTDGGLSSYFGTLPKATKRLFKSDLNLYKSDSNLRLDKLKVALPEDWFEDDKFDPGLFGLLEDPGVLRLEFDDYPDTVWQNNPNIENIGIESHEWIRKSYDCLDLDIEREDSSSLGTYKVGPMIFINR